ncbi:hypothetical protein C8R46DRAFT_380100 [Mycena filopes]|nr:hypothetical protein C8R46DRAFT_380100 [Mycena filopes]
MANWMLVCRDWLNIVLSVVFRDLWITSDAHIEYIIHIHRSNASFVCELAGITDIRRHLAKVCRSLTISVYHCYEGEYAWQCTDLIEYATTDSPRRHLLPGRGRYDSQEYAIPTQYIARIIRDFIPHITVLHFVLLDCTATYGAWGTFYWEPFWQLLDHTTRGYPLSLTELHVTYAYTSPPPALLLDAPRGTFFPPPSGDMPSQCRFEGIRRLVVWDANADFIAFMTTACPLLERVESTAEFRAEDVPENVPADVKDRLVFVRLPRTVTWGLTGSDTDPIPDNYPPKTVGEWRETFRRRRGLFTTLFPLPMIPIPGRERATPLKSSKPKKKTLWRFLARVFRKSKP